MTTGIYTRTKCAWNFGLTKETDLRIANHSKIMMFKGPGREIRYCLNCNKEFLVSVNSTQKYCSLNCCWKYIKGKNNPNKIHHSPRPKSDCYKKPPMKLVCRNCKKEYFTKNINQQYCSRRCFMQKRFNGELKNTCIHCGAKTNNNKFCSRSCYWKWVDDNDYHSLNSGFKKGHIPVNKSKSNSLKGKKLEEIVGEDKAKELKLNQSIRMSERRRIGKCKGGNASRETNPLWYQHICEANSKMWDNPEYVKSQMKARHRSKKYKNRRCGTGIGGFRKDIGIYVRSRWEANYVRILNLLGIKWRYELKRFIFDDNSSYLPDFYLENLKVWVEVKGYRNQSFLDRIKKMQIQYPNENIKILDSGGYQALEKLYSSKISNWE